MKIFSIYDFDNDLWGTVTELLNEMGTLFSITLIGISIDLSYWNKFKKRTGHF